MNGSASKPAPGSGDGHDGVPNRKSRASTGSLRAGSRGSRRRAHGGSAAVRPPASVLGLGQAAGPPGAVRRLRPVRPARQDPGARPRHPGQRARRSRPPLGDFGEDLAGSPLLPRRGRRGEGPLRDLPRHRAPRRLRAARRLPGPRGRGPRRVAARGGCQRALRRARRLRRRAPVRSRRDLARGEDALVRRSARDLDQPDLVPARRRGGPHRAGVPHRLCGHRQGHRGRRRGRARGSARSRARAVRTTWSSPRRSGAVGKTMRRWTPRPSVARRPG